MTTTTEPAPKIVREGHGANCSSLGSVIDTLFLSAVAAALKREEVRIVPEGPPKADRRPEGHTEVERKK